MLDLPHTFEGNRKIDGDDFGGDEAENVCGEDEEGIERWIGFGCVSG